MVENNFVHIQECTYKNVLNYCNTRPLQLYLHYMTFYINYTYIDYVYKSQNRED